MKVFTPYFNKRSRLHRVPELGVESRHNLPDYQGRDFKKQLEQLLCVQNDFYPCFDWAFPPPLLGPDDSQPVPDNIFAEPSVEGNRFSLYMHSPFCKSLCKFCYYTVMPGKGIDESSRYINYLVEELRLYAAKLHGMQCESVYFGGGTPSYLDDDLLITLFNNVYDLFDLRNDAEISIEAAPGSLPYSKIELLQELGVNRLSYGIQSLDEKLLQGLNREYSVTEAITELSSAVELIGNVNVDTMYGFDDEPDDALLTTLSRFIELGVPSLSIYSLDRQRCDRGVKDNGPEVDNGYEKKIRIFNQARHYLLDNGYHPVLQNIFIKPQKSTYRHQTRRWDNLTLVATGLSSQGYAPRRPYQNTSSLKGYYESIDRGELPIVNMDYLSPEMEMARQLTSQLRFTRVDLIEMEVKYGVKLREVFAELEETLVALGYLDNQNYLWRMTENAEYYNNIIPMLFAPDDFKEKLLTLPEEYIEAFPVPYILTQLGCTQSEKLAVHTPGSGFIQLEKRRQERRQFEDIPYMLAVAGFDRRSGDDRRTSYVQ